MRIGLSSSLAHENPEQWAVQMHELGCRSVVFPVDYTEPDHVIADYVAAANRYDLLIAEAGIWRNVFATNAAEREEARKRAEGQLRLADEIGAKCCVNVTGTWGGPVWDGGYRENFTRECWDAVVSYTRELIDTVKPVRTRYCAEPMPWMIPTSPDEYKELVNDVDREAFGIHMDVVNMINCPQRYFYSDDFLQECFDKLGPYICSCHLKDIRLNQELTFQLEETFCGNGTLNLEKYITLIDLYNKEMPVIIEHLETDEAYRASLKYIQQRLGAAGIY